MRSTLRVSLVVLVAAAAVLLPLTAFGADADPRAGRLVATTRAIEWHPADRAVTVLSIQRPDGEVITEMFGAGETPTLPLEGLADGLYAYELHVSRANAASPVESGTFTLANGTVLTPGVAERPPLRVAPLTFFSDFVSAAGGLCGGADCTSAESMGTATIKAKSTSTRLKFEDTSTSAGFPTTDWQLSANDPGFGGANKFFLEDLTAGTVPLLVEGATPTNALYLDSTGRIGMGTSTPGGNLTISVPVSASIRMEQNASPFQTWDVIANNNNFYVRDVNHEANPFIIKTSASANSLVIDTSGRIGLGVLSPLYQIDHSSGARLDAGTWINASSRTVKQDIHDLDRDAALQAFKALQPVTFAYKAKPGETRVGFIAEDVPALVATADRKGLSSMDIVAVLTKVVQEQQRTIEELQAQMKKLEGKE